MKNIVRIGFKNGDHIDVSLGDLTIRDFTKSTMDKMKGANYSQPQMYCLDYDITILFNEVLYMVPLSFDGSVGIKVKESE